MQCSCATTTLAVFIRSVAHFDIETPIRHATNRQSFFLSRNKIIAYQRRQIQYGVHFRKSTGTQIPLDPAPSNGEMTSGVTRRWPSETALFENLDLKDQATDRSNEQTSSKGRNVEQQLVSTKVNTNRSEFGPKKGPGFSDRSFNDNEEAPALEISPEGIDTLALATRHLHNAHQEKQSMVNLHEMVLPNFRLGISPSIEAPTTEFRGWQKRDSKDTKSRFVKSLRDEHKKSTPEREPWQIQKAALNEKFKDGWNPRKRLSPDALAGIRAIHAQFPDQYPTSVLAEKFEVSPEAIRRILKSKWTPKEDEELDRRRRWFSRGKKVWSRYAELGLKPPARWRKLGIGKRGDSTDKGGKRSRVGAKITLRNAGYEVTGSKDGLRGNGIAGRIL
jgi:Neugrin